jgi:manganese/zinc/iron transport system permease protein
MIASLFEYFTDSVLRGPTIGSMLMCLAAALVGVIIFLRKQSLLGESLSHAAYPGVIFGVIFAGALALDDSYETSNVLLIMSGAFLTALLGLWVISFLENSLKIRTDSALCFVLSSFFGIGLTFASHVQFTHTALYRQAQIYLYGQAATMTDIHIAIYGILSLIVVLVLMLFFKELQLISFNSEYAASLGIKVQKINALIFFLTALSVVIGIRSVGVVLMSAMFISPAVAARQFTNRLSVMFVLAGIFGLISGFLGNYFSLEWTNHLMKQNPGLRLALPTGPMIVLVASLFCIGALLLAPDRGLLVRWIRAIYFRYQCACENILKSIWRINENGPVSIEQIAKHQPLPRLQLRLILRRLAYNGWLNRTEKQHYSLTHDGQQRAKQIVRLHRLWEVYLANYLGVGAERVHRNAEEIEHILTPELEDELTALLKNPLIDPHDQRIPSKDEL